MKLVQIEIDFLSDSIARKVQMQFSFVSDNNDIYFSTCSISKSVVICTLGFNYTIISPSIINIYEIY